MIQTIKEKKGITLVALVATVIILIILSGVTVGAINGGLFNYAGRAKTEVEETSTKSAIQEAYIMAKGKSRTNKVSQQDMQKQVNNVLQDENAQVAEEGDKLIVIIGEKYYEVDNKGKVKGPGTLEPTPNAGDITKGGACTGTQENPYKIECIEDLVELSKNVYTGTTYRNKYVVVTRDLDFNSIFSYSNYRAKYSYNEEQNAYIPDENSNQTIKELCTTGQGFIPISLSYGSSGTARVFRGIFYGEEQRIIKNIHINRSGNAALFGGCSSATIRNITVTGHIVSTDGAAAGIVAEGHGLTINHCYNKATIEGKTGAAGICVQYSTNTTVIECINEGDIFSESNQAFGVSQNGTLNKCINSGNVTGYSQSARNSVRVAILKIVIIQE